MRGFGILALFVAVGSIFLFNCEDVRNCEDCVHANGIFATFLNENQKCVFSNRVATDRSIMSFKQIQRGCIRNPKKIGMFISFAFHILFLISILSNYSFYS